MSASFGKETASGLRTTKSVWSVDAVYRDISGKAMMTKEESEEFSAILSEVGKIFAKLDKNTLDSISKNEELLLRIKTFMNTKVRAGQRIGNTTKFTSDLVDYLLDYFGKEDEKRKTPRGKEGVTKRKEDVMKFFQNTDKKKIQMIFDLMNLLVDAKLILIKKMDQAKSINTLLRTKDGYKVTGQEGFVAIDKKGNAVKLVDRLQFSNANFSSEFIKGWQR
jgi:hypothetical protein